MPDPQKKLPSTLPHAAVAASATDHAMLEGHASHCTWAADARTGACEPDDHELLERLASMARREADAVQRNHIRRMWDRDRSKRFMP